MEAIGVTTQQLRQAAGKAGVAIGTSQGGRGCPPIPTRKGLRFVLKTAAGPNAPYRRTSQHMRQKIDGTPYYPTIPGAVCWHGHRAFFRALFDLAPDAEVKTAMATYKGRRNFELTHGDTFGKPREYHGFTTEAYGDACVCETDRKGTP